MDQAPDRATRAAGLLAIAPGARPAILRLNNLHAAELSRLDAAALAAMLQIAFHARSVGRAEAFLLAFDQHADYASPNFTWFRRRYAAFVYVDRIAVAAEARGRGHARRLYADLFRHAAAAGHTRIACEVNADPPNPASEALHASLGFSEVGRAVLQDRAKTVRYLLRATDTAQEGSAPPAAARVLAKGDLKKAGSAKVGSAGGEFS